jgi:predicted Fe-Mo cluster-binding NifX family protein
VLRLHILDLLIARQRYAKERGLTVKIAITAQGKSPDATLDRRFGRAPFVFVGDSESGVLHPYENEARLHQSGAGIAAAQSLVDQGVEVLITGEVGPKAAQVLQAAGIKVHRTTANTVPEALAEFQQAFTKPATPLTLSPAGSRSATTQDTPVQQKRQPVSEAVVAVATDGDSVAQHFGRCEEYTLATIKGGAVVSRRVVTNPGHEPDFLPGFLAERGVTAIIAGGMGPRAIELFKSKEIDIIVGVSGLVSEAINGYRDGCLLDGESSCTH